MTDEALLRLAVAQSPADLAGTDARLGWLASILPVVVAQGADLLLLPELFASGYNIGADVAAAAQPADGTTAQAMAELARRHRLAIHYGYPERVGDRLYNSAQCFDPEGKPLDHYRKQVIPPGFEQDHFTPGKGCTLFRYRGVCIATLICYDAEFPEAVRQVAQMGAQLVLVPTALSARWGWVARQMMPTRAFENGIYLAYANSAGVERGTPYLGESVIAGPDGTEVARAGADPEIIYGDVKLAKVAAAQVRLPYLSDCRRFGIIESDSH